MTVKTSHIPFQVVVYSTLEQSCVMFWHPQLSFRQMLMLSINCVAHCHALHWYTPWYSRGIWYLPSSIDDLKKTFTNTSWRAPSHWVHVAILSCCKYHLKSIPHREHSPSAFYSWWPSADLYSWQPGTHSEVLRPNNLRWANWLWVNYE